MTSEKATLFGDTGNHRDIMASSDPAHQKYLGRSVSNFIRDIRERHRYDIVLKGNLAKFSAPPLLQTFVTGDEFLAESSLTTSSGPSTSGPTTCEPSDLSAGRDSTFRDILI